MRTRRNRMSRLSLGVATFVMIGRVAAAGEEVKEHTIHLESERLHLLIADNEAYGAEHKQGYNGISANVNMRWARSFAFGPAQSTGNSLARRK